jgi:DNA-binding NtrC family response regulator
MKILIIDDDKDLLDMTIRRYQKKGIEVECSQNLHHAKEILKQHLDIKAIICDLFLVDGENGMNFYENDLKESFQGKFVLSTGDDTADMRIEKYKQEDQNFTCFQKPYSIDDVIKFLQK